MSAVGREEMIQESRPGTAAGELRLAWLLPFAAMIAALLARAVTEPNVDVSALLTFAGKLLAGARPYVDFIDLNPPASILLYVPAVVMARAFGISPEIAVEALTMMTAAASLAGVAGILRRAGLVTPSTGPALLAAAILVLTVLPARSFAEREHIGAIALLPWFAVIAARVAGVVERWPVRLLAGAAAGCAVVIKPHFALACLALLPSVLARTGSIRRLFDVEWVAIVLVGVLYLLVVWAFFPAFLTGTVGLVADVYLPTRLPLGLLLVLPGSLIWALLVGGLCLLGRPLGSPASAVLIIASAGGALAFVLQGKGWPYHSYPAIAWAALALALKAVGGEPWARSGEPAPRISRAVLSVALACLLALSGRWFDLENPRNIHAIAGMIERAHPRPRLMVVSGDVAVGHPVVRLVGGEWVQRFASLWISFGALKQLERGDLEPARREHLERYVRLDQAMLADDLRRGEPHIILAEVGRTDWRDSMVLSSGFR